MTMAFPRPSARPAYLDNLFRDMPVPTTPSLHSSTSSISCSSTASNYDLHSAYHNSRPLTPAIEESIDDTFSLRSKKSTLSPRKFRFGRLFGRRTYPSYEVEETSAPAFNATPSTDGFPTPRRPSLPKLQTSFPPPRGASAYAKKPLPAPPRPLAQELSCSRCYYYTARNCHGFVLGGKNGDACETCLRAGFFGAK